MKILKLYLLFCVIVPAFTADLSFGQTSYLNNWNGSNPLPQENYLSDVVYGNGAFIIVGDYGKVLRSNNGNDWFEREQGIALEHLRGIAYGDNTFIAVGDHGTILTSNDDGITWTSPNNLPITFGLYGVAFGNGVFVVVGENGTILSSSDHGATWTSINCPYKSNLYGVTYSNDIFVAVGQAGPLALRVKIVDH